MRMSQTFACLVFFYHVGVLLVLSFSGFFWFVFFGSFFFIIFFIERICNIFFFPCLMWVFVLNDRARCQQQTICKACYGARWASQLLLQFWIPPVYAKLAALKSTQPADHIPISLMKLSPQIKEWLLPFISCWWMLLALHLNYFIGIFYSRGWSVLEHKQHWEFDLGNTTFSINIWLNGLSGLWCMLGAVQPD